MGWGEAVCGVCAKGFHVKPQSMMDDCQSVGFRSSSIGFDGDSDRYGWCFA